MPKPTPKWKNRLPEFFEEITFAQSEDDIRSACETFKRVVSECYPDTPDSRRRPMSEVRKAIRERFPAKESTDLNAPFPYFFTEDGKGGNKRWEHLAIKHLKEEWNPQKDWSDIENPSETTEVINTGAELNIFDQVGLSDEDLAIVKEAIGDADIKEWVRQAMLQRANAINALRDRLDEDLSIVPSEDLMTNKKYRTNPVACRELTSRAVRAIKSYNAQAPEHKWCITNKLISELTGNTVKAIARAVEGMDLESYNKSMDLQPVHNRLTKAAIGDIKEVVSIKDILGVDE